MKRLSLAVFLLCTSATASADLAPLPPPEACTVENVKGEGEECLICVNTERPDTSCQQEAQKRGFTRRCTTQSAGISDIWCGAPAAPRSTTPPPVEPDKSGICSVNVTGDAQALLPLALFFGLLGASTLRKRRSSSR